VYGIHQKSNDEDDEMHQVDPKALIFSILTFQEEALHVKERISFNDTWQMELIFLIIVFHGAVDA
jgi:uncharacterized protein (DUF111 family)